MKCKPTDKEKKWVKDFIGDVSYLFNVSDYQITYNWREEDAASETGIVLADITVRRDYKTITINIYQDFWDGSKTERAAALIHEMCHTITNIQQSVVNELLDDNLVTRREAVFSNEQETTTIASLIFRLVAYDHTWLQKGMGLRVDKKKK